LDARSRRVALIAHCLINQNSIVQGLARYPAMVKELVDILSKHGVGIVQLPCPETLYLGLRRFWQVREQYDTYNFREFAREIIKPIVTYVREYVACGYEITAVIGIAGSPSCGVFTTSSSPTWAGDPSKAGKSMRVRGRGVFMEELLNALKSIVDLDSTLLLEFDYSNPDQSLRDIESRIGSKASSRAYGQTAQ